MSIILGIIANRNGIGWKLYKHVSNFPCNYKNDYSLLTTQFRLSFPSKIPQKCSAELMKNSGRKMPFPDSFRQAPPNASAKSPNGSFCTFTDIILRSFLIIRSYISDRSTGKFYPDVPKKFCVINMRSSFTEAQIPLRQHLLCETRCWAVHDKPHISEDKRLLALFKRDIADEMHPHIN